MPQEAAFLAPLLQHLQQAGVLVAAPLVANNGQSLLTLKINLHNLHRVLWVNIRYK
jgi:Ser/Thr protein kinase RdoA (MazF antagonist)